MKKKKLATSSGIEKKTHILWRAFSIRSNACRVERAKGNIDYYITMYIYTFLMSIIEMSGHRQLCEKWHDAFDIWEYRTTSEAFIPCMANFIVLHEERVLKFNPLQNLLFFLWIKKKLRTHKTMQHSLYLMISCISNSIYYFAVRKTSRWFANLKQVTIEWYYHMHFRLPLHLDGEKKKNDNNYGLCQIHKINQFPLQNEYGKHYYYLKMNHQLSWAELTVLVIVNFCIATIQRSTTTTTWREEKNPHSWNEYFGRFHHEDNFQFDGAAGFLRTHWRERERENDFIC